MPLAPMRIARPIAFFIARRKPMRFSSCWAMFSATSWAFVSGVRTSTMEMATFLPMSFSTSWRSFSISVPPLPMITPGREQWMKMRTWALSRSISMVGTPAAYSLFLRYLRILSSSTIRSPTLSGRAYQRESQSLMTPTRRPCGLTFCPINQASFSATTTVMWLVLFRIRA